MIRIAIYTLTRDRLEYTKHCFQTLQEKAGLLYDHYVVDNGSQDQTPQWLQSQPVAYILNQENLGISIASNQALDLIKQKSYDYIIKFDNDCEIVSTNILPSIIEIFNKLEKKFILSPRVEGIQRQPTRVRYEEVGSFKIGVVSIIGGLFHVVPANLYSQYSYPIDLPKAWGQDDDFNKWVNTQGYSRGYIEHLVVNHYETSAGQKARFPQYWERKLKDEKS